MINRYKGILLLLFICQLAARHLYSQVKLPLLISDGMVMQRDKQLKLWGWASAGEEVNLSFGNNIYKAKADATGRWHILLPPQKAGAPQEMIFRASNEIRVRNILFGDVWICSGQSNMELTMDRVRFKYAAEIASANYPMIRQFTVPDKYNFKFPEQDLSSGRWIEAGGKSLLEFSAVAYFFAMELYKRYKIPIGLINAALGGSPAESWISEEAIKNFPEQYKELQAFKNDSLIAQIEKHNRNQNEEWYSLLKKKDPGFAGNWKDPMLDDLAWDKMMVPGYWGTGSSGQTNGSVWFRRTIQLPASMTGKQGRLELGRIVDADSVFVNGIYVGNTTYQYPPRRYTIPAGLLGEGINSIVVRVVCSAGRGGFVPDKPYRLITPGDTFELKGEWKQKWGAVMNPMSGQTTVRWKPVGLYNAMIAPLLNYSIKGIIWYQGESNAGKPAQYGKLMQTLIEDWRKKWMQGNFPFIFVQLPNFMEANPIPSQSNWATLRQAQLKTLAIPRTGMVVAIDAGEWNDIHPENKEDIGFRLSLQARKLAYGENKMVYSGPLYTSMKKEGNKITLSFTNTGSGLVTKNGSSLRYFAIAGSDQKYVWAKAEIRGNKVIVWNEAVPDPVAVRYAWADNPEGANLYNKEGLPASPFGTND